LLFGKDEKMEKIRIRGMSCQHCVMSVTKALTDLPGVKNVRVDLVKGEATFEKGQDLAPDQIRKAIEGAGYTLTDMGEEP
jgi:copper chaperone